MKNCHSELDSASPKKQTLNQVQGDGFKYRKDIESVLNLDCDFSALKDKAILITGATGLIGSAVVDLLMSVANYGLKVFAAGRNSGRAEKLFAKYIGNPHFHFLQFDVTQNFSFNEDFDFIIDSAGASSPFLYAQKPVEVMESNILGVKNLLDYGKNHGLKKFVYVSSGEIYGEDDVRVFTEDYSGYVNPLNPRSCYPVAKRAAETFCVSYAKEYGVEVSIARPCHVYGPNFSESDNRVYAQFIRDVLDGEDIVLKSKGEQFRSWIYVDDCAVALLYILLKGKNCEAYNIANSESNFTIRELAEIVARQAERKVVFDIPFDENGGNTTPITKAVFSTAKLNSLGWKAKVGIEEGIKRTIGIMKER